MKENELEYDSFCVASSDINRFNYRYYRDANRALKLSQTAWNVFNYLLGEQDYANRPNKSINGGKKGSRTEPNEIIISFRDLAESIGLSKSSVRRIQSVIDELEEKKLVQVSGKEKQTLGYTINYKVWDEAITAGYNEKLKSMDTKRKRKPL